MSGPGIVLALVLIGITTLASFQLYRTRELPVRGRTTFALIRSGALALAILLILDPLLPGGAGTGTDPRRIVVDGSLSMLATLEDGTRPVDAAESRTEARPGLPVETTSRIADAVASALEAGATEVTIVSDLRLRDGVALRALGARTPARLEVVDVGGRVENAGVSELDVPTRIRPGESGSATVRLHGEGEVEVLLTVAGDTVARTSVVLDPGARERTVVLDFTVPADVSPTEGTLLAVASVVRTGDGFEPDDRRFAVMAVDDPGGGIVALSARPDWEFRTLLPVLADVTGVPVQGFLRLSERRWLRTGSNPGAVDGAEVREALAAARLTILHGFPVEDPDDGILELARRTDRVMELAPSGTGWPGLGTPQPGEWYVAGELPPSTLAADLTGIPLLGLPPLARVRMGPAVGPSPLGLQRGGAGEAVPAFSWIDDGEERSVIARAEGFWRWGIRSGAPRELYRRLWSGVTAWLLAPVPGARATGLGPVTDEVGPDDPVEFRAGLLAGGRVVVDWTEHGAAESPAPARTDTLAVDSVGLALAPGFPEAGVMVWTARSPDSAMDSLSASGVLVVQGSGEELRIPRDSTLMEDLRMLGRDAEVSAAGRPLRSHPAPWILLVLLLSLEWIGRRRAGLR